MSVVAGTLALHGLLLYDQLSIGMTHAFSSLKT